MWHSLNAFETEDSIVADFVGYQEPDHFIGEKAAFRLIMQGRQGLQQYAGTVRRYVINLRQRKIVEEAVSAENHEFPIVDAASPGIAIVSATLRPRRGRRFFITGWRVWIWRAASAISCIWTILTWANRFSCRTRRRR